ncbi:uncharacterized protein HD556DRAFT_1362181 [Suillus plorans]|uniref:Uncharacterized protein n=1 Tax=Suillus plorans TaxID=116603 RepID=A0A9P7AT24_9AGAM|nr:uncharacterized protein HD556DRAFT_1362181 [Suillus plorans]KAG1795992.1 hypothetical protein HD556DRAFT_1362181 [Suillus plorans]
MGCAHLRSSANALIARLSSFLHCFRPNNDEATELLRTSRPSAFHLHVLLARLSSFIHHSPPESDSPDKIHQLAMSSQLDPRVFLAHLSSFLPRPRLGTDEGAETHFPPPLSSRPDALISRLRSQPHTNEEIEHSKYIHNYTSYTNAPIGYI